jgi:hypothetical protein
VRSRAEQTFARWLYDREIKFEYERWHYTLPTGEGYVPDFWLPDVGVFIEVKAGQVQALHKPWILAHVLDDERLYVWSYGILWQARPFGWSPDVIWVRCDGCSRIMPMAFADLSRCRACGGERLRYVPRNLRRSEWRKRDPVRRWRPEREHREAVAA